MAAPTDRARGRPTNPARQTIPVPLDVWPGAPRNRSTTPVNRTRLRPGDPSPAVPTEDMGPPDVPARQPLPTGRTTEATQGHQAYDRGYSDCGGSRCSSFATVTVGMPTRRRLVFVPLDGATVGPGYLKVVHDKNLVKKAPSIDTDGVLPAEDEPGVFAHYELEYAPGAKGERRLARR